MEGSIKEVRKVYRSPARREKGKKSNEEDMHPEEDFDVELHAVMEKLYQERSATITQGNPIPQVSSSTSPDLPLALYHTLDNFFFKL